MRYKLLAIDIIGTLVDPSTNKISNEVKQSISKISKDLNISLVSSMPIEGVSKVAFELDLHDQNIHVASGGKFIIDNNGNVIKELAKYNKGTALHEILLIKQIIKRNVIAVGDGILDIEMFNEASTRIAMGNADIDLKRHADYIIPTVYQNGVVYLIDEYFHNNNVTR